MKSRLSEFIRFVLFSYTSDSQVERHVKFVRVLIDFKHRFIKNLIKYSSKKYNTVFSKAFYVSVFSINHKVNKCLHTTIHMTAR